MRNLKFVEVNMNSTKYIDTLDTVASMTENLGGIWMTIYFAIGPVRLKHRMKNKHSLVSVADTESGL